MEKIGPRIEALLEEWSGRTTKKQRVTGTRLHKALEGEGMRVAATTVRRYLCERKRRQAEVFVPLVHRPGDEAQVDFFEVTVDVAGVRKKVWKFVMRLMFSGRDYVWLYDRCDQVSFLDAHVRAFEHFGGVPHRCIYDNLSAAVRKVMPRRDLAPRFRSLAAHYVFEPCFARPGVGHDKGGVEARGKGIRLRYLTPIPQGDTLSEIASWLLAAIDRDAAVDRKRDGTTVMQRFTTEQSLFLPLPDPPFEPRLITCATVSRQSLVKAAGAYYSVPSPWKQLQATVMVGVDTVTIARNDTAIEHPRMPFGGRSIQYTHYLEELAKKPQAVRQVVVELLNELGEPYGELWRLLVDAHGPPDAARVFARVLEAITEHDAQIVAKAIARAIKADRLDPLGLIGVQPPPATTNPVPSPLANYEIEAASAADYDALLVGES
jgi:transposase